MASKIECPYCSHLMVLKTVKNGRFKPTCSRCHQLFVLTISGVSESGEGEPILVADRTPEGKDFQDLGTRMDAEPTVKRTHTSPEPAPPATTPATPPAATPPAATPSPAASNPTPTQHGPTADDLEATAQVADDHTLAMDESQKIATAASAQPTFQPSASSASPLSVHNQPTQIGAALTRNAGHDATGTSDGKGSANPSTNLGRLGGYRLIRELGRGGMGSVFLANQLSLDRQVAIKTIQGKWASSPRAIARFIREAYAAAQLVHHNIVQIYDLGEDKGTNFFSMELVTGGSLDELLKKEGRIEPRRAATLVLQAARGLKFAHDHGMVHRDVKPANLMLNAEGLVKVADLGLVKTEGMSSSDDVGDDLNPMLASANTKVTGAGSRMGTPAYMAPEQADDASSVDMRADVYSLGCTFYALLTGKPPFSGRSVDEMITKHKSEPLVRPDKLVAEVTPALGAIVEKMTAKRASDRYEDLTGVITDLESYLSTSAAGREAAITRNQRLVQGVAKFKQVPATPIRVGLPLLFMAVLAVLTLIGGLISWRIAVAALMCGAATPVAYLGLTLMLDRSSPVSSRMRLALAGSKLTDWITWTFGLLLTLVVIFALGLFGYAIAAVLAAVGAAFAYRAVLAVAIERKRAPAVAEVEGVLREIRLEGTDEEQVKRMVADACDKDWEELYEAIYDYDAMIAMRTSLADSGKLSGRRKARPLRDLLVNRLDSRARKVREDQQRKVLQKIERASLKAEGKSDAEADRESQAFAHSMIDMAAEARVTLAAMKASLPAAEAFARRQRVKAMLQEARGGKAKRDLDEPKPSLFALLSMFLGGRLRFAIGACLIVGCVLWLRQNGLLDAAKLNELRDAASQNIEAIQQEGVKGVDDLKAAGEAASSSIGKTEPLKLPIVGAYFDSLVPGLLGLLIAASSLLGGFRLTPFAILAAVLGVGLPQWGLPDFGYPFVSQLMGLGIGVVLMVVGAIYARGEHG